MGQTARDQRSASLQRDERGACTPTSGSCGPTSSYPCLPRPRTSPASGRAWRSCSRRRCGCRPASASRASSICSGTRRPASSTGAPRPRSPRPCPAPSPRSRCAFSSTSRRRAATRKAPYKVACEDDTGPHRSRVLPCRAQVHRAPAADGQHPHRERPHRELQRQEADGASRLHRRARSARRPAHAGAGLPADRRPLRQGAAEGRPASPRARARSCPSGRTPPGSSSAAGPMPARRLPRLHRPRGALRRLAGLAALAAPRLRRAAGRPAGAGAGAAEPQVAARAQRRRRRPRPRQDRRRAALRPHQLAAPGAEGDRRGHGARRTACCGCCRATSAPARPWWR